MLSCIIILYNVEKHFCRYCLQAISTKNIKMFIKDCFKINDIKKIIMPKKGEYVKLKNYEIKIKRHQLKFRQILKIF